MSNSFFSPQASAQRAANHAHRVARRGAEQHQAWVRTTHQRNADLAMQRQRQYEVGRRTNQHLRAQHLRAARANEAKPGGGVLKSLFRVVVFLGWLAIMGWLFFGA